MGRDAEILVVAEEARDESLPMIVTGDLNDVALHIGVFGLFLKTADEGPVGKPQSPNQRKNTAGDQQLAAALVATVGCGRMIADRRLVVADRCLMVADRRLGGSSGRGR